MKSPQFTEIEHRFLIHTIALILLMVFLLRAALANPAGMAKEIIPTATTNLSLSQTVKVAGRQLTGDPVTLTTINQLNLSGHDIVVNRWQSQQGLDDVMHKLSLQLPKETLAWGDAGVVYMS